jgi:hypothetical protein
MIANLSSLLSSKQTGPLCGGQTAQTRRLSTIPSRTTLPGRPSAVVPTPSLSLLLLLRDLHDIDTNSIKAHALKQILRIAIDVQLSALRILREVQGRNFWHVLIFSLALFFLQLEGNTTDGTTLDTLHQMGGVAGDLWGKNEVNFTSGLDRCGRVEVGERRSGGAQGLTLLRRRFEAMIAISSQMRLLVSKSRVSFG